MSVLGSNLPTFRSVQLDFAAHIRNPEAHPRPADVEPRRMAIYVRLFFNNIKNFVDTAFPIARKIVGEEAWHVLVREFVHKHASQSPYFLQVSEEFMTFLSERGLDDLPPFLLELCHYEWVELSLDMAVEEFPASNQDSVGDPLGAYRVSPLMRVLVYDYPVHQIGVDFQPEAPPGSPTFLIVYRNADFAVRFMESNPVTHRLVELLKDQTAAEALTQIQSELAAGGRDVPLQQVEDQGLQTLTHLCRLGIIMTR